MALDGMIGNGVRVAYSADSPIDYVVIGQILDCDLPGLTPDEVETTVHGPSFFKRFIRGMIDVKETNLKLLQDLDAASSPEQRALFGFQSAGTTMYWRIEVPTERDQSKYTGIEFRAWVKNYYPHAPIAGRQELDVSLRFDGTYFNMDATAGSSQLD